MKCKRCNSELKRKGDFCNNCINEMKETEENINDNEAQLILNRKYSLWYQISSYVEPMLILLFMFFIAYIFEILDTFMYFFAFFILLGILKFVYQIIRIKTDSIIFYKTRLVYVYNFLGKRYKVIKYKNIKTIEYTATPTILQRMFKIIDIEVKAEKSKLLFNKLNIKTIEKNDEILAKISKITRVKEN